MPTRVFAWIAALLAGCTALIGGIHALARQQDPPPHVAALLPDPTCPAPCWQGFRPGYMEGDALQSWLADPPDGWRVTGGDGTLPLPVDRWQVQLAGGAQFYIDLMRIHSPAVDQISLLDLPGLQVGHLIAALGAPSFVDFFLGSDSQLWMRMFYPDERLIAQMIVPDDLRPGIRVDYLIYDAMPWSRPALAFDWRGFGSITRYYPEGIEP